MAARPEPVLYHFSHDGSIRLFVPRPSRLGEDFVWAVDDLHAWTYSVPRECPRASFWAQDGTSQADIDRFLDGDASRTRMVLEDRWMPEVESATLWRYILPPDTFVSHDGIAGHWVSREPVAPAALELVADLPGRIRAAGVHLRSEPSLVALWLEVIASSLEFSGTRLRNCHDCPAEWREPQWYARQNESKGIDHAVP